MQIFFVYCCTCQKKAVPLQPQRFMIMKKHILLAFVCALVLVGCQEKSPECKYHKVSLNLTVKQPDWKFDDKARLFYYAFDVPEITRNVYDFGEWSLNREFDVKTNYPYQVPLPMNTFKCDTLQEDAVVYYTQYIDYRVGVGYVEIQLTNSDYLYGQENPESMSFRLQANDAIVDLTLLQADWKFDEGTKQYYYHFNVPEITEDVYNFGHWSVAREYNYGTADAYQVDLPMSCFMTDTLREQSLVRYTQQVDYRVGVGYVEVQLLNSDYFYDLKDGKPIHPEDMYFRLQLTY